MSLRRRLHHGDLDGKTREQYDTSGFGDLSQPLLGDDNDRQDFDDNKYAEVYKYLLQGVWDDQRQQVQLHWTILFSQLIAQWAQWLANIVIGSGSLLGQLFSPKLTCQDGIGQKRLLAPSLSPLQA
ncbi:hypothetical protein Dimus_029985 [Dionaea muscipula]